MTAITARLGNDWVCFGPRGPEASKVRQRPGPEFSPIEGVYVVRLGARGSFALAAGYFVTNIF